MNTAIIKVSIIFISLFLSSALSQSQLQTQFEYAVKIYNEEKYFDAVTEFKRLQFFDSLNQFSFLTNKFIALSYKAGGKFDLANKYFALAEKNTSNIDSIFQIRIETLKVNLLKRNLYQAFNILDDLKSDKRFESKKNEITYWFGWAYIFNNDWDKASNEFSKIDSGKELERLCRNVSELQYSKTKAKVLSYIIPGAGQFYTGNYLSGILSFSWMALWSYLSLKAFAADRVFDGVMIANFLAFRFYNGNLQNAENFVDEKNEEISNWMLNYLQNNYLGDKP